MNFPTRDLGKWGENLAADYLIEQGYTILDQNVHTPYGELDLVTAQPLDTDPGEFTIVFIEVKTRRSQSFGFPEESITASKQEHIISSALHYMQQQPNRDRDWRVDVITIELYKNREPIILQFENAIHE